MEPTHEIDPTSGELPMPVSDTPTGTREVLDTAVDVPLEAQQSASTGPADSSQATVADPSRGATASVPVASSVSSVPMVDDSTLIADDTDLIEKEWVIRAKAVVEQTKTDPYLQNRELNKVKAEYIKKRYNKDVKVSEE